MIVKSGDVYIDADGDVLIYMENDIPDCDEDGYHHIVLTSFAARKTYISTSPVKILFNIMDFMENNAEKLGVGVKK